MRDINNLEKVYNLIDKYFATDVIAVGPEGPIEEIEFRKEMIELGELEVLRCIDNGEVIFI